MEHKIKIGSFETTAEKVILEALERQAENLTKAHNAKFVIVEDWCTALVGNMWHPSALWIEAKPTDNFDFAKGTEVLIFPKSEESAKQWKSIGIGKVLSVVASPNELISDNVPEIYY